MTQERVLAQPCMGLSPTCPSAARVEWND